MIQGLFSNFYVEIQSHEPTVKCVDRSPEPAPSECQGTLEYLPNTASHLFSAKTKYHRSPCFPRCSLAVSCTNPWPATLLLTRLQLQRREGRSDCMIIADTTDYNEYTWMRIWHAAVAIDAMCVRHGRMGIAYRLGEYESNLVRSYSVAYRLSR